MNVYKMKYNFRDEIECSKTETKCNENSVIKIYKYFFKWIFIIFRMVTRVSTLILLFSCVLMIIQSLNGNQSKGLFIFQMIEMLFEFFRKTI